MSSKRMITWSSTGVSVAIVATACIGISEFFKAHQNYAAETPKISGVLGGAGLLIWLLGRQINRKSADRSSSDDGQESGSFFVFNLQYWGFMSIILAGVVFVLAQSDYQRFVDKSLGQIKAVKKRALADVAQTVEFPNLDMQGVIYAKSNPSVLLNGKTYFVGDRIGAVEIAGISEKSVTLKLQGKTKQLFLKKQPAD